MKSATATPPASFDLLLLAALWGGSFVFMRVAVPEWGAVALVALRVGLASVILVPWCWWQLGRGALRGFYGRLWLAGMLNSALPFLVFSYAMAQLSAGLGSVLNATAALWGSVVAWLWLKKPLRKLQVLGLGLGFGGVVLLCWEKILKQHALAEVLMVLLVLLATLSYGIGANYTQRYLNRLPSLAVAAGSQLMAALTLLPLLWWFWPENSISAQAWGAVLALAGLSTALAYVLFFRLIARWGATRAVGVTYLIPVFGVLWGMLFLAESLSLMMFSGALVVLLGVWLLNRGPSKTG